MKYSTSFTMDNYYGRDRLQELWQQIGTLHLSYLEMEESPQKLQQRHKLEDFIHEFLCLAPHNQKFVFRETVDVLHRSASTKKDFSGYKAALGWNAIAMYAANLVNQPWRKEYKQIQLYSGFYKHQIDSNLVGAEVIFEVMGYKHDGDGILTIDGPICPDRVISVSQDALIAYVECQILKAIWEEVSTNFKITWLEVLEFREAHLCGTKQSIQGLNYLIQERQYRQHTRSYSQGTDSFANGPRYSSNIHTSSTLSTNHSFPPLHSHTSVASIPLAPQCIYGTAGCYPNNFATYAPLVAQQYPIHMYTRTLKPMYHNPNCFPNGYAVPQLPPPYVCSPIPTGQLIEVESPTPHHYDTVDGPSHSRSSKCQASESCNLKHEDKSTSEKDDLQSDQMGSWDYVYKNLESKGYSKDLGERGDLLSQSVDNKKLSKDGKKSVSNLDSLVNNLHVNDKEIKSNEVPQKFFKERTRLNSDISKSNEVELNAKKQYLRQGLTGIGKSNTLSVHDKTSAVSSVVNNKLTNSSTIDGRKAKQILDNDWLKTKEKCPDVKVSLNGTSRKWHCSFCTFLNECSREICEMCSKSRIKVQDNMVIGGPQCPACTLVNPKDNKVCEVCKESLENSPTYI